MPEVAALLPDGAVGAKIHFSAVAAKCLPALPGADRAQVVLAGVEAHVVPAADGARADGGRQGGLCRRRLPSARAATADRDLALARMRQEGVRIVAREMVVFEWLGEAGTPLFREVSRKR